MTSPYLTQETYSSHVETVLDRVRFATDIAPLIGGTVVATEDHEPRRTEHAYAGVQVGDLVLHFSRDGYNAGKVSRVAVSCGPTREVSRRLAGVTRTAYPAATFDTGRPLDVLAKSLLALIEKAQPSLTRDLATAADMDSDRDKLTAKRAGILRRFPSVRIDEPGDRGNSVNVYASGEGFRLSARLNPRGGLYVDRLSYDGDPAALFAFLFDQPEA